MAKKFLTDIDIAGGIYDSSGDIGNSGQVLSSTGSGLNWIDSTANSSVIYQDAFSGNGSATAFTLANSVDDENKTQVYVDGVYQFKNTYSISGTTLTFSTAPPNNTNIEVISFNSITGDGDILTDSEFGSAGLMTTNGSGVYSITTNNSSNWNTAYTYSQVGHLPLAGGAITGAITTNSTFDGRDVSADGTKLDGIETSATADQTDAEIRTAVEAATDSNVFTDADHTKLNAIEASATADQTAAEIRVLVEAATDSNVFTDADHTKLNAIEASADVTDTTNVTAAGALMDSEVTNLADVKAFDTTDYATAAQGTLADSAQQPPSEGAFANGDKTKLDGIAAGAEVNVQSDWSSTSGDNLILNKPSIPSITGLATETYVDTAVSDLVDSSPATLNTLNELAAALGDDPNFATTTATSIGLKAPLASPSFTGNATFAGNVTASSGTGHFSVVNSSAYQLNGTYVMDSSRNLVNIASITASGSISGFGDFTGINSALNTRTGAGVAIGKYASSYAYIDLASTNSTYGSWIDFSKGDGADYGGRIRYHNSNETFTFTTGGSNDEFVIHTTHTLSTGSSRAPIFYDSSNTGYYTYPSNQSVFYRLKLQGTGLAAAATLEIDNPSTSSFIHTGEIFAANMTAGQANIIVIGKEGNTKNSGYIGYNWAANASNNNYVSIGHWGENHIFRVYGDVITSTVGFRGDADVRGTIFYDTNNTAYFLNPNVTSNVNAITWSGGSSANANTAYGWGDHASPNYYSKTSMLANRNIVSGTDLSTDLDDGGAYSSYGSANTSWNAPGSYGGALAWAFTSNIRGQVFFDIRHNTTDYSDFWFRSKNNLGYHSWSKVWHSTSPDIRAPLFYDSNDTSYYVNPASESKISKLWINNGGQGGVPWSSGFNQGSGSNYWNMIQDAGVARQRNFGTGGYDWFSSGATQLMTLSNGGTLFAYADMRAPIFYDSANTAFFVNPAAESNLGELRLNVGGLQMYRAYNDNAIWFAANSDANHVLWNDYYGGPGTRPGGTSFDGIKWNAYRGIHIRGGTGGAYNVIVAQNTSSNANTHTVELYAYNVKQFQTASGYALANNQMRSPIFYDSLATSYYVDPGSATSVNVAGTVRGNYYVGTNYATDGYTVYKGYDNWNHFISVRGHCRPGQGKTQAAILGGHQTSFVEYAESNSTTGWFFIGSGQTNYIEVAKITRSHSSFTGSVRAPLFYDTDNTGYYVNPNATSKLAGLEFNFTQHGSANNIKMGNSTTMNAISSGTNNAAFGVEALGNCSSGSRNFAYGYAALFSLTSGGNNIAMGDACGYNVSSGSNNLLFGQNAGRTGYQSPQSIGGVSTASNQIHMGNESHSTARIQISWTVNSDSRDKTDVTPINVGLDFVKDLNPVTFRWDKRSDYEDRTPTGENKLEELTLGFLAQEVETVEKSYGYDVANKTNLVVDRDVENDGFGLTYEKMIPILTKAIQELEARVQELENK